MAFTKSPNGVVQSGVFDRSSPTFESETEQFSLRLGQLQKKLGFTHFIVAEKEVGATLYVHIIPAAPPAPNHADAHAALGLMSAASLDRGELARHMQRGSSPAVPNAGPATRQALAPTNGGGLRLRRA